MKSKKDIEALQRLQVELYKQKKYEEYLKTLKEIVDTASDSDDSDFAKFEIGKFYEIKERNLEKAIECYKEVADSQHLEILLLARVSLGICYYQKKDFPNARQVFSEVVTKYPNTSSASTSKGFLEIIDIK
ncbi:MAG: tetratricopeptide repeat protein [Chlamydiae bacterium]|nr:tetratricopeptide repeat protein [Chlamydiota bacterium]MBI3266405.1 tetratricopeptide repeat protein [Chlamydiota bacterium]